MTRNALLLVLLVGCSDDSSPAFDARLDGDVVDGNTTVDASQVDALVACSSEGQVQVVACGNCGEQSQRCTGGYWTPQSACLSQGECAVGNVETGALPLCGEQQRLCGMDCSWGAWSTTVPGTGECEPGETGVVTAGCPGDLFYEKTCNDACAWVVGTVCTDGCSNDAATTPPQAEEICVPAGLFVRGAEGESWEALLHATPVRDVYLDAYYIDRYPATIGRFKECIAAGGCTGPDTPSIIYDNPAYADYTYDQAAWIDAWQFCQWAGRRLPTEAEYEKAARGPAPRTNLYPWEGVFCSAPYALECGWSPVGTYVTAPYDAMPQSASYYGVEQLLGVIQWTNDWAGHDYYSDDASLVNPQGPASGTERTFRGARRENMMEVNHVTTRFAPSFFSNTGLESIRCARTPSL